MFVFSPLAELGLLTVHNILYSYRLEEPLLRNCTGKVPSDTHTILRFKYYRAWKTLSINGEPVSLASAAGAALAGIDIEPIVHLSPTVRIGTTKGMLNFNWFNRADAVLFSSQLHFNAQCALPLHLVRRPGKGKEIAVHDIVLGASISSNASLITISLRPNHRMVAPTFHFSAPEFSDIDQASPSSTYSWRAGILLPLMRYFVLNVAILFSIVSFAVCLVKLWACRYHVKRREGLGRSLISPIRAPISRFWRDASPAPPFADSDSTISRLWHEAISRAKTGVSQSRLVAASSGLVAELGGRISRSPSPRGRSEKRLSTIEEEFP